MKKVFLLLLIAIFIISCSSSNEPEQRKPKTSIEISKTKPNDLIPLDVGNWWIYEDLEGNKDTLKIEKYLGVKKWIIENKYLEYDLKLNTYQINYISTWIRYDDSEGEFPVCFGYDAAGNFVSGCLRNDSVFINNSIGKIPYSESSLKYLKNGDINLKFANAKDCEIFTYNGISYYSDVYYFKRGVGRIAYLNIGMDSINPTSHPFNSYLIDYEIK